MVSGMPKIDLKDVTVREGSSYPSPFDEPCQKRSAKTLGDAAGLTQFGVRLVTLPPGAWSAQRHWHMHEDEFVYVVDGELVLIEDAGKTTLTTGECAGFPCGVQDGHHLVNESDRDATFLVVGTRDNADHGEYPDIDMKFGPNRYAGKGSYTHKDGTPY